MPEDIHISLWGQVRSRVEDGVFCWNAEIAAELTSIVGKIGNCLADCNGACCLEIGQGAWPWNDYLAQFERMRVEYKSVISEYNGNRKNTVNLTDVSIVALGKTLGLPVMSMEKPNRGQPSEKKMRIPDLCAAESIKHFNFNQFLRAEGITT